MSRLQNTLTSDWRKQILSAKLKAKKLDQKIINWRKPAAVNQNRTGHVSQPQQPARDATDVQCIDDDDKEQ